MTIEPEPHNSNLNKETIHGYELKTKLPEIKQDTPWSCVIRFTTSEDIAGGKSRPF